MNKLFFKIDFHSKTFKPVLLPNQESNIYDFLSDTPIESYADLNEITTPDAVCLKFPMKTVFVTDNWNYSQSTKDLMINHAKPIHYMQVIYHHGIPNDQVATQEDVEMYVEYLIYNNDLDTAKSICDEFASIGYGIDFELKKSIIIEPVVDPTVKIPLTPGLRGHIEENYPTPDIKKTGFHIETDTWQLLLRNSIRIENTMLIGATGTGKTELVKHIADALGKKLYVVDMGTIQDSQSALLGVHRLNKEGYSEFDYAPFAKYIQEDCIILLDELSRAPLSAANILFPCLDRRRYLPIDIAGDGEERHIPVNENVMFFATANLGSEYTGTNAIDRALMDRFFPIELDYPTETAEINILNKRTGIDKKQAKVIVKISKEIRKQFKEQELSNTISVRHTLQTASLVQDGFELLTSLTQVILPMFEDSDGGSERSKVKSIIAAH
jgi:MoxR-like ATPase